MHVLIHLLLVSVEFIRILMHTLLHLDQVTKRVLHHSDALLKAIRHWDVVVAQVVVVMPELLLRRDCNSLLRLR